jgi:uncharacterized protein YnzC (UPF0291/DUF896 family)
LKELYKTSKKLAMEKFNKVAVGDVREDFLKQLKEKMTSKLAYITTENEKSSE